jgi:outer membrane beta-barrel protein
VRRAPCAIFLGVLASVAAGGGRATAAEAPPEPSPGTPAPHETPAPAPAPAPAAPAPVARLPAPAAAPVGGIAEPAPRPVASVRVQSRFAEKAGSFQAFGGLEYLSRGDFYVSPGVRVGGAYYLLEALGFELHVSRYFSSLNAEAERVKETLGALPDSHAPAWMMLAGARYSIGYGKIKVGGLGRAIHFEPQAFAHGGLHVHDGDVGPSADFGLGFLVFLNPRLFVRIDAAVAYEREERSGRPVSVWGTIPSLSFGGVP